MRLVQCALGMAAHRGREQLPDRASGSTDDQAVEGLGYALAQKIKMMVVTHDSGHVEESSITSATDECATPQKA